MGDIMAGQPLNQPAEIPAELDRWNWGAFFLNWIWGIGNSTFIALLALIPVVNLIMIFVLGARGSRWAWQNGPGATRSSSARRSATGRSPGWSSGWWGSAVARRRSAAFPTS
ncbi:hypothetical protein MesoLj113a_40100 [Mesorhizobium sp. 113-1-2]|nr:hypothetical protein MLTONO_1024 [Mesorhizobium loti]BCG72852.1 hypothetical protein MesoLj113a_40100 [Mesorhizobium sp. 113-1-2]